MCEENWIYVFHWKDSMRVDAVPDSQPSLRCLNTFIYCQNKLFFCTFLQVDPTQKAVCIIPTLLYFQTIITVVSAKRRHPHHKSHRSAPHPTSSHSDRLSLHAEVMGSHPESSPPPPPPVTGPLCLWHILVTLSSSCLQLTEGGVRPRSGSGRTLTHSDALMWFSDDSLQSGRCCRCSRKSESVENMRW